MPMAAGFTVTAVMRQLVICAMSLMKASILSINANAKAAAACIFHLETMKLQLKVTAG